MSPPAQPPSLTEQLHATTEAANDIITTLKVRRSPHLDYDPIERQALYAELYLLTQRESSLRIAVALHEVATVGNYVVDAIDRFMQTAV